MESLLAVNVCFYVLEQTLQLVPASKTTSERQDSCFKDSHTLSSSLPSLNSLLTSTIFTSPLVRLVFSAPHKRHKTDSDPVSETSPGSHGATGVREKTRGRRVAGSGGCGGCGGKGSVEGMCIAGVGRLLSTALRGWGEFKSSSCFLRVFDGLIERVLSPVERTNGDTGEIGDTVMVWSLTT